MTKTGAEWYGRKVVMREAVLYSCILRGNVRAHSRRGRSHGTYLNLRMSHSTALMAGMSLSFPPTRRKNASTALSNSAFSTAVI